MAIIDKVSLNLSTKLGEKLNKTNEEIDTSFYKVDKNSNKSKNESLKENGFIKL